jgi:NAD(P)-dependent dehydrogenase (short-subunit alcohol dehydrogenase family)
MSNPRDVSEAVLISGCSTGIGRATAQRLASGGWTVYATARRLESIKDLGALGCRILALDVTDEESMRAAVATVVEEQGAVGALVNNAGFGLEGPVEEVPLDEWRRQFETNVFGLVRLSQLALPGMRAQGWGRIVNVGSMGGRLAFPGGGPYHASKYAVEALSDALRFETRGFGVHVSVIEPGPIKTEWATEAVVNATRFTPSDSPYARFATVVASRTASAYEGLIGRFASQPDAVAKAIEHALGARPRSRYRVTAAARMLIATRKILPDVAWDAMMRTVYPTPRPEKPR